MRRQYDLHEGLSRARQAARSITHSRKRSLDLNAVPRPVLMAMFRQLNETLEMLSATEKRVLDEMRSRRGG